MNLVSSARYVRLGRLIVFIPHPVTTGFTTGIAVVIATLQLKDLLGMQFHSPESYVERWRVMVHALPSFQWQELAVGAFTLLLLVGVPRLQKKVPAPLIALAGAAAAVALLHRLWPEFQVATIGTRFNGIPQAPPMPLWPWNMPGPAGAPFTLDFATIQALVPAAFAIAMLGAIESLLAAVVADGMTGTKHDPNAELLITPVIDLGADG